MNMRTTLLCLLLQGLPTMASGQLSAYSSVSYGYHHNPLYNYLREGDQLTQTYFEFGYLRESGLSRLNIQYVGGLVLFNRLSDRNFYEHSLSARYMKHHPDDRASAALQLSQKNQPATTASQEAMSASADSAEESESDSTSAAADSSAMSDSTSVERPSDNEEEEPAVVDSSGSFWSFSAKASARHDREIYQDFDNQGLDLGGMYRVMAGESVFLRLTNGFSFRSYPNLSSLSNVNDVLSAELGFSSSTNVAYGILGNVGLKYYTESQYDTTRFQSSATFNTNTPGKGKGGGIIANQPSKKTLIQPKTNGTLQVALGLFFRSHTQPTDVAVSAVYRRIPRSSTRYLAQTSGTSLLTEDIYNDQFSSEGFEFHAHVEQALAWKIKAIVDAGFQNKSYEAPALDLFQVEIDSRRTDIRSEVELYLSRYFELSENFGIDAFLGAGFVRNQSNDDYNDFSSSIFSFGIGIGF
jgi:hypothetical protein